MRVTLLCSFIDYTKGTKTTMYGQENGKYFILQTPINPDMANAANVYEYRDLTQQEALDKME